MKPLRIAFISSRPSIRRFREEGSFIYRCENLALALKDMGHKVSLVHIVALIFRGNFDIAVFLRPSGGRIYDYVTNRLRAKGVTLIGDIDDLIFDPEYAHVRPSVINKTGDEIKAWNKFVSNRNALSKLDKVVVSTDELARHLRQAFPKIECVVIPNAGHRTWLAIQPAPTLSERSISYFSGTRTHDRDFDIVAPTLERLLNRHPDLTVRIVGPLSTNLNHPRVIRVPKVPFQDYAQLVRTSHICIAPLEDTPFNQCKSALKALEAGMMNVPTVASPVSDYAKMNINGVLIAETQDEWEARLEFALDPGNYKKLSDGLRERMIAYSDLDDLAKKFLNFAGKSY